MRQRGFSLLEIILAAMIFSLLTTVLAAVWVLHARAQMKSSHLLVAADLADLEMETALAQGYFGVSPATGNFTQTWNVRGQTITNRFESKVEVLDIEIPNGIDHGKLVVVTITFNEGNTDGTPGHFRIESMLIDAN